MVRRSTDNRASSISEHGVRVRPGDFFTAFSAAEVEQSIPRRFERQVAKYPNHLAVKRNDQAVSYRELNRLANRIARLLLSLSATREEPVAIVADNHTKALAGILGILKAGKVYVPLDASFSPAWARFIFDDTEPAIVLATSGTLPLAEQWSSSRCRVIDIENLNAHTSDDNPEVVIAPTALAHILYTSGSTDQPKGVLDIHRNVLHHVMRVTNRSHISAADRMAVLRPPSSSGALLNAFSALLNGTSLYVLNHYAASMALATELAMDPLRAHIHWSLGRLHRRERLLEQARTELSQALAAYRSMEMPFWKDTAEQEISELGAH